MESKNATSPNTDEKLSDEEFKKLIPHLDLNQLFLIEFKKDGNWRNLFDTGDDNASIKDINCGVCSQKVSVNKFKEHLKAKSHIDAINEAERFYSPLYTERRDPKSDLVVIENEERIRKANFIAAAIEVSLSRKHIQNHHVHLSTTLEISLKDLLRVEFQEKMGGKWRKMMSSEGNQKYTCHICRRFCVGIITVNAHLRGNSHRLFQESLVDLRLPGNARVNKHSILASEIVANTRVNDDGCLKDVPKIAANPMQGLIGVEYIARIQKDNREYVWVCCLCHPNNIINNAELTENHLIGHKHRRRYCELHYPDTVRRFEKMVKDSGVLEVTGMIFVLAKIADAIEKHHGYGKPFETTYDYYLKERENICKLVDGLPHACQNFGPLFTTVVSINDIRRALLHVSGKPHCFNFAQVTKARFLTPLSGKFYLNMRKHVSRFQIHEDPEKLRHGSVSSTERHNDDSVVRSISPHSRHLQKRRLDSVGEGADVWETYRHRLSESASNLEKAYLEYRQRPEEHPSYDKEWSIFWKYRKAQLQHEGIDCRSYDFQPEWTVHFRQRLEQLFGEQLQNLKNKIRRQLDIPLDAEEDSHFSQAENSLEPPTRKKDKSESRRVDNAASQSRIPQSYEEAQMWNPQTSIEHDRPNIIGLLRLMTALEEHLGSMGEKILDLLTNALSLEKVYSGDSAQLEQRILNSNNCRLLKSAQEKLKSQLYAGLVENKKINSFNRVIESAEVLLDRADFMGWSSVIEPTITPPLNNQIEKFLEVLQEKTKGNYSPVKKKSLPDTLIDLMGQKRNASQTTENKSPSKQMDQSDYRFENNSKRPSHSARSAQTSFSSDNFRSNLGLEKTSLPHFQAQDNNFGVWNRLGGQPNTYGLGNVNGNNNAYTGGNISGGSDFIRTANNNPYGSGYASGGNNYFGNGVNNPYGGNAFGQ